MAEVAQDLTHGNLIATPLTGTFGARVDGIDLGRGLTETEFATVRSLLRRYKVLVFHDQASVGPKELFEFGERFGKPEVAEHVVHPSCPGFPAVKVLVSSGTPKGEIPDQAQHGPPIPWDSWHTDGSTRAASDLRWISILQAIEIPPVGRDTLFADMEAAYENLSPPMKAFLSGLRATHLEGALFFKSMGALTLPKMKPPVDHPVVLRDPVTGRDALYVNRMYTTSILGLRPDESEALLNFLYLQAHRPEYQLRVAWEPKTIVVWENARTQHYLVQDAHYRRVMHRVMALEPAEAAS